MTALLRRNADGKFEGRYEDALIKTNRAGKTRPVAAEQRPSNMIDLMEAPGELSGLAHDPEKWVPVFGRDHARKIESSMAELKTYRAKRKFGVTAEPKGKVARKKQTSRAAAMRPLRKTAKLKNTNGAPPRNAKTVVSGVTLTHPDRVYWADAGVSKRDLAEFYTQVWTWMRPHVVGRPIALLRCPEGAAGQCFLQKHAAGGIGTEHLHLVLEKGDKIISIGDLAGLVSLVQAGVLEIHTRGTTVDDRERGDRLVFDLDPGPGTGWKDVVAAAREVRERLARLKLKSFVKTSGGKGLHVVLPIKPAPWDQAKDFAYAVAASMAADAPARYTATVAKNKRNKRIFVDYLRNSREATAVAPYSTRARPGAPVSTPIEWSELGTLKGANQFTVRNLPARLARLRTDPWATIGRLKQALPTFK